MSENKEETKKKAKSKGKKEPAGKKRLTFGENPEENFSNQAAITPLFPIVGIGASAGGLEAFEKFFRAMPPDSGLAFILVPHLSKEHPSLMPELLQKFTGMKVFQANDGMKVQPNCVYITVPNKDIAILRGWLQLLEPAMQGNKLHFPINLFFKSLAQDKGKSAICVILSGTGTDGTQGLKSIREKGGIVMVQDEDSAQYKGMPQSAISTGLADYILLPEKMPASLIRFAGQPAFRSGIETVSDQKEPSNSLSKIFILVRNKTGHDFSLYKQTTICRRIERRMTVHQIERIEDYIRYLQHNPEEIKNLFKEFLIDVTNFLRDPEAHQFLKKEIIPAILKKKSGGDVVRVWVPGCSSGEEAYSIAFLFRECMVELGQRFELRIFGTDLNERALETARSGLYPANISDDVGSARLKRFFIAKQDSLYQINKSIREMLIFATQNVISDPPFTRLDLICCRNLLIYLTSEAQKKLLPVFHYSLNPGGYLFLGSSESVGEYTDLFKVVEKKWKIFKSKPSATSKHALMEFPITPRAYTNYVGHTAKAVREAPEFGFPQLVEKFVMDKYAPTCVIIDSKGEIVHVHGRTRNYLEISPGTPSLNIFKAVPENLYLELTSAVQKALVQNKKVVTDGIKIKFNGGFQFLKLSVLPVTEPDHLRGYFMVVFEEVAPPQPLKSSKARVLSPKNDQRITELQEELTHTKKHLQATIEKLETANEEIVSTNEELLSTNEEFQSANEELATSKEELQSLNEELVTVNAELQLRIEDLTKAKDDIKNLFDSTEIATIFLDADFVVQRFTPKIAEIFKLISTDVGRSLSDIVSNLKYKAVLDDAKVVLDTLVFKEIEVQTKNGNWYLMKITPYRTITNVIAGVVMTFVDITQRKQADERLRVSEGNLNRAQQVAHIGSWDLDLINDNLVWSEETYRIFGITSDQLNITYERFLERIHPDDRSYVDDAWTAALYKQPYDIEHRILIGNQLKWVREKAEIEFNEKGQAVHATGIVHDITERKLLTDEKTYWLAAVMRNSSDAIILQNRKGEILAWNLGAARMYGYTESEALGMSICEIIPEYMCREALEIIENIFNGKAVQLVETQRLTKGGQVLDVWLTGTVLVDEEGNPTAVATTERDITQKKRTTEKLRKFSYAVEQNPCSIIITDLVGDVEYVNPAFTRITGYSTEEIVGKNPRILNSGKQSSGFYKKMWETINSGRVWRGEFQNKKKSGKLFWESASISPIVNQEGITTHYIAIKEDITDRKRIEENSKLFRELIDNSNDAIFITDPLSSRILDVNNQACSSLGYTSEELLLLKVEDVEVGKRKTRQWKKYVEKIREQGSVIIEGIHKRKNGTTFPVELGIRYLSHESRDYLVCIVRNLSQRKK